MRFARSLLSVFLPGFLLATGMTDAGWGAEGAEPSTAARPNIVVFLADDLGWADVGWHGKEAKTPHLDALANSGVRLEHFYVQPLCSPTRAALMTGRYPMRHGLQVGVVRPWAQYGLPLQERTLAQALKEAGYETAICGKWHLGHFEPAYLPTHRGFDHQYGHYNGALDYFTHERDGGHDWHRDDKANHDEGYSTHLIAREAERRIQEHNTAKPLFLYVPFNAVHGPHQVPEKYKAPFHSAQEPRRTYLGMLAAMDEAIGEVVKAVDQKGLRDNTLFFFSSDNGGPSPGRVTSNGPLKGQKGGLHEGGVRVPALMSWKGKLKPGSTSDAALHMVDLFPTLVTLAGGTLDQSQPLDGRDAWNAIANGAPSPHEAILLNTTPTEGAILAGGWKLLVRQGNEAPGAQPKTAAKKKGGRREPVELYHIVEDPYEKTNLASTKPDKVREMKALYESFAKQAVPPKAAPIPAGFRSPKVWGEKG